MNRGQFHKTAKQELRLKFFFKWKVYSYSVSQNLKLKSTIFPETSSRKFHWCFSLTSIEKPVFRQCVLFSLGLHFETVSSR